MSDSDENNPTPSKTSGNKGRFVVLSVAVILFVTLLVLFRQYMNLDFLAQQEMSLKELYSAHPVLFLSIAFLIYALVTGLSIPGATVMSLMYAWFFKFWTALLLISFASTTGATIAFLLSRYLLQQSVQQKFATQLTGFNKSLENEGPFYLFTLRLIPAVPFFVINAVMGLTKMKAVTFWWVSQLGMLAGTIVYVYAGSIIPDLQTLQEEGINAVFTPWQMGQITAALIALGLFPLIVRKIVSLINKKPSAETAQQ